MSQIPNVLKIYVGDTYRSYLVVEQPLNVGDNGGEPVDADALPTMTIYKPDGALFSDMNEVHGPSPTGVYYTDIVPTIDMDEGIYRLKWDYTLEDINFEKNEYIYIVPEKKNPDASQYAVAEQIRSYSSGMDLSGFTDEQLNSFALTASRLVDDYCRRSFGPTTETEQRQGTMDVQGRYMFVVKKKPITKINSIHLKYVGYPTAQIEVPVQYLDNFFIDGYIIYAHAYFMRTLGIVLRDEYKGDFYYTIEYEAGGDVPAPVSLATVMLVQNILFSSVLASGTGSQQSIESSENIRSFSSMSFDVAFNESKMFNEKTGRLYSVTIRDLLNRYVYTGQSW